MYPTREELRELHRQENEKIDREGELEELEGYENTPRLSDDEYFNYISHNSYVDMRNF